MLVNLVTNTVTITGPAEFKGRTTFDNGCTLTEDGKLVIHGEQ